MSYPNKISERLVIGVISCNLGFNFFTFKTVTKSGKSGCLPVFLPKEENWTY